MDKKTAGWLGVVAGLATATAAHAATRPVSDALGATPPMSYADLLAPISNPVEALKADDAARAWPTASHDDRVAQGYYYPYYSNPNYYYAPPVYYNYPYHYEHFYHHHHHHHHHHHGRRR